VEFVKYLAIAAAGYLLGNFNTGLVVSKLQAGIDIRRHGSGNAGATNMLRVLGSQSALLTLIGDIAKGLIAIAIGFALTGFPGGMLGATAAIVGHCWPVFFGFQGGKGVATTAGTLLCLFPVAGLLCVAVFVAIVLATRLVSLGSVLAALFGAVFLCVAHWGDPLICCGAVLWAAIIVVRHHANLKRLWQGTESKLYFSKTKR
jgi:glycerol-3-phosphate acyltransferase PlsY